MLKKIIKYTLRALLVVLVVLILVPALLYIPAVQDFVRKRAVGYASRALGMDLSVERLRLSFPLRLSVDNTLLVDKADTLLSCGRLSLDVALWPLVRKEVVIRSFGLERVAARYKDSLAGMDMRLRRACCPWMRPRPTSRQIRQASPASSCRMPMSGWT